MKYIKTYEKVISLNLDDEDQKIIFYHALNNDKVQIVKDLLKHGMNPNLKDKEYSSYPILLAQCLRYKPNIEIIQLLIDAGADANAIIYGETVLIQEILINMKKNTNKTALIKIFEILIKSGADINKKSRNFDFFDGIDQEFQFGYLTKGFVDRLMKMIKEIAPEKYEQHIMEKDADKYNL